MVTELKHNQIFVFGSNLAGRHGKGAALYAKLHFNAQYGIGVGPTGRCYALPTKDYNIKTLPLNIIKNYLIDFVKYAEQHPELEFLLTPVGTGLAGYTVEQLISILPELPKNVTRLF